MRLEVFFSSNTTRMQLLSSDPYLHGPDSVQYKAMGNIMVWSTFSLGLNVIALSFQVFSRVFIDLIAISVCNPLQFLSVHPGKLMHCVTLFNTCYIRIIIIFSLHNPDFVFFSRLIYTIFSFSSLLMKVLLGLFANRMVSSLYRKILILVPPIQTPPIRVVKHYKFPVDIE